MGVAYHALDKTDKAVESYDKAALDQNIQNVAILINCTPEVVETAVDLEEHVIKVPPIARPR